MNTTSEEINHNYFTDDNATPNYDAIKQDNLLDVVKDTPITAPKRLITNTFKTHMSHIIEFNRVINKENISSISELIKCKLCFNILVNPFDCESCGNTFCHNCIENLRINHKTCLFKCQNFQIKPSSFGITSLLSTLSFECKNKESGCKTAIPYLDVINHDIECTYQSTICPNFKCNRSIKRQFLEYHIRKECLYTLFKCENCETNFIRAEYLQHIKNCKLIEDIFDEKNPIIHTPEHIDLGDISLKSFMQILLYNLSKNDRKHKMKLNELSEEIKSIKEVVNRQTNNTILLIENLHSEVDYINEKLIGNDFHNVVNDKVSNARNGDRIVDDNSKQSVSIGNNTNHSKTSSNNSSTCNTYITNQSIKSDHPNTIITNTANNTDNNKHFSRNTVKPGSDNNCIDNINNAVSNVKKIKIQNKNKAQGGNNLSSIKANKSPLGRLPPGRSPVTRSPNPRTLYLETESSQTRTGHMALLKSTLKNQENILENLNKVIDRVNQQEVTHNQKMERYSDEIKDFIKFFLIEKNDFEY